jgi:hypothetical protein
LDSHFNPELLPSHFAFLRRSDQSSSTVELHVHGFFLEDTACHSSRTLSFRTDSVLCLAETKRRPRSTLAPAFLCILHYCRSQPQIRLVYSTDDLRIKPSNLHDYCRNRTDGILSSERCLFTTAPRIQKALSPPAHPRSVSQQQRISRRADSSNVHTQRHEDLFIAYQRST